MGKEMIVDLFSFTFSKHSDVNICYFYIEKKVLK